jgi:hypothetical protein
MLGSNKDEGKSPAFWMAIETIDNWEVDRKNGFCFLGIVEYRIAKAHKVRAGDFIFVYVPSPYSGFADVRRVEVDGVRPSSHARLYSVACSRGVATSPVISLDPAQFTLMRRLIGRLTFVRPGPLWGNSIRSSFRSIVASDASEILAEMAASNPELNWARVQSIMPVSFARIRSGTLATPGPQA